MSACIDESLSKGTEGRGCGGCWFLAFAVDYQAFCFSNRLYSVLCTLYSGSWLKPRHVALPLFGSETPAWRLDALDGMVRPRV